MKGKFSKNIKFCLLLFVFFVTNFTKSFSEEVTGTILFKPSIKWYSSTIFYYEYLIGTNSNPVVDRHMFAMASGETDLPFDLLTQNYLKEGSKFIYENKGLKPFEEMGYGRIIAIITPDGQEIELTQMFPLDIIKNKFPLLWEKLVREKRIGQ